MVNFLIFTQTRPTYIKLSFFHTFLCIASVRWIRGNTFWISPDESFKCFRLLISCKTFFVITQQKKKTEANRHKKRNIKKKFIYFSQDLNYIYQRRISRVRNTINNKECNSRICRFMSISNMLYKNAMHRHSDLNNNQPEDTVPLIDHDHQHNICKCKCSCLPRFLTCCFSVSCLHCKYTIFFNFFYIFFLYILHLLFDLHIPEFLILILEWMKNSFYDQFLRINFLFRCLLSRVILKVLKFNNAGVILWQMRI